MDPNARQTKVLKRKLMISDNKLAKIKASKIKPEVKLAKKVVEEPKIEEPPVIKKPSKKK